MGLSKKIKLGILTSSRADFGIYLPLLKSLKIDNIFDLKLIVFGTHLSKLHGFTYNEITESGFKGSFLIDTVLKKDNEESISLSFSKTTIKFSEFWKNNFKSFDYIFCLGDRYEMAAAVLPAIPFGIKFIHLHGGETSMGAIDNIYRDIISLSSHIHFVSCEKFKFRLKKLLNRSNNIFVSGSLSLQGIDKFKPSPLSELSTFCNIDLSKSFILVTVHPETVNPKNNKLFVNELVNALKNLSFKWKILITMPNNDTYGSIYRQAFNKLSKSRKKSVAIIENLGKQRYFTSLFFCDFLIGNSSSGIIESASFNKFVLNLGDRQKGRLKAKNIIDLPFVQSVIEDAAHKISGKTYTKSNPYYKKNPSTYIKNKLKKIK